jgi:hypothetical protein
MLLLLSAFVLYQYSRQAAKRKEANAYPAGGLPIAEAHFRSIHTENARIAKSLRFHFSRFHFFIGEASSFLHQPPRGDFIEKAVICRPNHCCFM